MINFRFKMSPIQAVRAYFIIHLWLKKSRSPRFIGFVESCSPVLMALCMLVSGGAGSNTDAADHGRTAALFQQQEAAALQARP